MKSSVPRIEIRSKSETVENLTLKVSKQRNSRQIQCPAIQKRIENVKLSSNPASDWSTLRNSRQTQRAKDQKRETLVNLRVRMLWNVELSCNLANDQKCETVKNSAFELDCIKEFCECIKEFGSGLPEFANASRNLAPDCQNWRATLIKFTAPRSNLD